MSIPYDVAQWLVPTFWTCFVVAIIIAVMVNSEVSGEDQD